MMRVFLLFAVFAVLTSAAFAHHGWGSYDASKPLTVTGPIVTSKFENPHATITVQGGDKLWTVTLAPTPVSQYWVWLSPVVCCSRPRPATSRSILHSSSRPSWPPQA